MIYIGLAQEHQFDFPYELSRIAELQVTYRQHAATRLVKGLEDCRVENGRLLVDISLADSLCFDEKCDTRIQIWGRFYDGTPFASRIMLTRTNELLTEDAIE